MRRERELARPHVRPAADERRARRRVVRRAERTREEQPAGLRAGLPPSGCASPRAPRPARAAAARRADAARASSCRRRAVRRAAGCARPRPRSRARGARAAGRAPRRGRRAATTAEGSDGTSGSISRSPRRNATASPSVAHGIASTPVDEGGLRRARGRADDAVEPLHARGLGRHERAARRTQARVERELAEHREARRAARSAPAPWPRAVRARSRGRTTRPPCGRRPAPG